MKGSGRPAPTPGHLINHMVISGGRVVERSSIKTPMINGKEKTLLVPFNSSSILVVGCTKPYLSKAKEKKGF